MTKTLLIVLLVPGMCWLSLSADDSVEEKAEETYWQKTKKAYEELTSGEKDLTKETKKWIEEDLENIGDWEYRIVEINDSTAESIQMILNKMGKDRWECFFVDTSDNKRFFYFKKSKISYLQKLSKADLGKILDKN